MVQFKVVGRKTAILCLLELRKILLGSVFILSVVTVVRRAAASSKKDVTNVKYRPNHSILQRRCLCKKDSVFITFNNDGNGDNYRISVLKIYINNPFGKPNFF
jgi:hypothetical protein